MIDQSGESANSAFLAVYTELKSRILTLQYKPGRGLSTESLAQEMGVSRSPTREALLRLTHDAYVETFSKRGTRVSLIDLDRTTDERFLRKSIEMYAIPTFVLNRTNENLKELRRYIERQKECAQNKDYINLIRYDDLFHKVIFKGIGKLDAWIMVHNSLPNDSRIRLLTFALLDTSCEPIIENHEDLIYAAEKRDVMLAERIMDIHLTRSEDDLSKIIHQVPEIFTSRQSPNTYQNIRTYSDGVENYYETLLKK